MDTKESGSKRIRILNAGNSKMGYHSYKGIISYIYRVEKPGGYVPLTIFL